MDNNERVNAVIFALNRLGHDQTAVGLGFKLTHDPTKCARCQAYICILQLSSIVNAQEIGSIDPTDKLPDDERDYSVETP